MKYDLTKAEKDALLQAVLRPANSRTKSTRDACWRAVDKLRGPGIGRSYLPSKGVLDVLAECFNSAEAGGFQGDTDDLRASDIEKTRKWFDLVHKTLDTKQQPSEIVCEWRSTLKAGQASGEAGARAAKAGGET